MIIKNGFVESIDGIKIIQDLIPTTNKQAYGYPMIPQYITIHNTGNSGASAKANSDYADKENGYISWHFTVGNGEVYQEMPINISGWHCGDGSNGTGNRTSIGIEIAEVEGAEETAIKFVAQLLQALNMDISKVVPHKKWSGKICPRLILPHWNVFIANIEKEMKPKTFTKDESVIYIQQEVKLDINSMNFLSAYMHNEPLLTKLANAIYKKEFSSIYKNVVIDDIKAVEIIKRATGFSDNTIQYLKDDYKFGSALIQKLAKAMI